MLVRVRAVGAITSVGIGARQSDASLRAGLCRFRRRKFGDQPVDLALANEEALAVGEASGMTTGWSARLAALAGLALADALGNDAPSEAPVALMLGLADPQEGVELPEPTQLFAAIARVAGHAVDLPRSRIFPRGRAAIFDAVAAGQDALAREPGIRVVCGAVDSYADEARVAAEIGRGRTLGRERPSDGRALAEAAGMLVLKTAERGGRGMRVAGLGRYVDAGHRFGSAPALGEGLSNAIEVLRSGADPGRPWNAVWAGLTGEAHDVKQWGTALLRHRDLLPVETRIEHPADRIGDAGAGLGAMLFVDAHNRLEHGSALLWASSDHGAVGCATVFIQGGG
jgi:3-oxoacyl-[acyl-carrier-protein] synthase-1